MKKEPTINIGFVMMHGPENEHLKKGCAGLYISIVCQRSIKDEGLHNGDYQRPNGQFGIKVPADADGIYFSSIICNLNCTYSISPF